MRSTVRVLRGRLVAALVCALGCAGIAGAGSSLLAAAPVAAAAAAGATTPAKQAATATTEQCNTSAVQAERSATFVGEMNAVPGTARMMMRIEILEHTDGESGYRSISYPGIGAWLRSTPGVKTYKNLDKVIDLSAPAMYRAEIHFRWLNSQRRTIKYLDLRTPRCVQTATPQEATEAGSAVAPAAG